MSADERTRLKLPAFMRVLLLDLVSLRPGDTVELQRIIGDARRLLDAAGPDPDLDRLRKAVVALAWRIADAQCGFSDEDAEAIVGILETGKPPPPRDPAKRHPRHNRIRLFS